jgi:hypothetical protein
MASTTRTRRTPEPAKMPPPAPPETAPQPVAAAKRAANGRHIYGTGPAPPKTTGPPNDVDFWDWLSEFTNDQWQHLIAYLWRYAPITDRRANGKPTSIRKYGVRFDLERIMLDEGSGGYRIDLVQIDPGSGAQKRIAQHYFSIMNMSYPPRIPLGEWTDDPENEMYKWAEPALRARDEAAEAEAHGSDAAAAAPGFMDPNAMFNTVLNGMRTLRGEHSDNSALASQILQMVQNNQAQMMALNDPVKQLETLKTLLAAIAPPANTGESVLITILRDELKSTREEMKELRNKPQAPGILEELLAKAPQLQELGKFLGFNRRGAGDGGTDWGQVAIQAMDKLAGAIPYAIDSFRNRQNTPPGQAGFELQPRPQYQPPQQQAPPQPQQQSTDAQPEPGAAAGTAEEEETRRRLQGHLNKYQQLITAVAPFLIDQYKSGLTGYDFRDWFVNRHGVLNWTGLKDEVGAADLCALAQLHPHLKAALAPPEKLLAFLTEVFTEPGQEPAGTTDEEDERPTVVTMPQGRA